MRRVGAIITEKPMEFMDLDGAVMLQVSLHLLDLSSVTLVLSGKQNSRCRGLV